MPVATYNPTITITGSNSVSASVTASFTVTATSPVYVPVSNITGVPATATATLPLNLTPTGFAVLPNDATNKTVSWNVVSGTGASVIGNTLNTTEATTAVTVRATITNGLTATTPYVQDFNITVSKAVLSGTVSIDGNAVFDQTLTANTSGLTSTPAISNLGTLTYQWKRDATNIGTNSATYQLVEADIAKNITVTVIAANCNGTITSGSKGPVAKSAQTAPNQPGIESVTNTSIKLVAVTGCEYNKDGGAYQDSPEFTSLRPGTTYSFTQRKKATTTLSASPASAVLEKRTDFFEGYGDWGSPYQIKNEEDLRNVSKVINTPINDYGIYEFYASRVYKQTAPITLSGDWETIGGNNGFKGMYDGGGYPIYGLNKSMFTISVNGHVRNIALLSVNIICTDTYIGGIAIMNRGTIENCYVTGNISSPFGPPYSNSAGGIAGYNYGVVKNCYTTCNVTGSSAGGIVGVNDPSGNVTNCYATGLITGSNTVGGIVGSVGAGGSVTNCVALNVGVRNTINNRFLIGRVVGTTNSTNLSKNYARNLDNNMMVVQYKYDGTYGINVDIPAAPADNSIHGKNANSKEHYNNENWWKTAANWNDGAWDFNTVWQWGANLLPILRGFNVTQNHTLSAVSPFRGDNVSTNPFLITDETDLKIFSALVNSGAMVYANAYYRLNNNITMTDGTDLMPNHIPIGTKNSPFKGSFDGNGKTISKLYIYDSTGSIEHTGLFGYVSGGKIKNLGLIDVYSTGLWFVGGVAGILTGSGSSIVNCYVSGDVSTHCISSTGGAGGIAAYISVGALISNCYTSCGVGGKSYIGGIVGSNAATVSKCYTTGVIAGNQFVGGIAGSNEINGTITGCVAANKNIRRVDGIATSFGRVTGYNSGTLPTNDNAAYSNMQTNSGVNFSSGALIHGTAYNFMTITTQNFYQIAPRSWQFGTTETSPWRWGLNSSYILPTLYWQTTAPPLPPILLNP